MARSIGPSAIAEVRAPTRIAICWYLGVEPTRKPVLRSCDVVPPFEAAIQTMPPIERAVTKYGGIVQPIIKNTRQVSSKVATVIPEIGFDEEPTSPVNRDETVTKRKPKAIMSIAPSKFHRRFNWGTTIITNSKAMIPPSTNFIERSWSVRGASLEPPPALLKSASPPFNPLQITGSERKRLMIPPAATAPAPI